VPWDGQIADILGISVTQLSKNLKQDKTLHATISSTCAMIRNYSLGQVFKNNNGEQAANQLKELCYGKGFALIEGKMVPLGVCTQNTDKIPKSPLTQDSVTTKDFNGKCTLKKNAYISKMNANAQTNQNYSARLERM